MEVTKIYKFWYMNNKWKSTKILGFKKCLSWEQSPLIIYKSCSSISSEFFLRISFIYIFYNPWEFLCFSPIGGIFLLGLGKRVGWLVMTFISSADNIRRKMRFYDLCGFCEFSSVLPKNKLYVYFTICIR